MRRYCLSLLIFSLVSCGPSGPPPIKPGTPAYFWQSALENYNKGDYARTADFLGRILKSENDFTARARVMNLVVTAGLVEAYRELAERYEYGISNNKNNPGALRRRLADYRSMAGNLSKQLGESYGEFTKAMPQGDVSLEFPYPARASLTMPPQMSRIAEGQILPDSDVEAVTSQMLQRGVLQQVGSAVGAAGDAAKAKNIFSSTPVKVERKTFELSMAKVLHPASALFGPRKRAEPAVQEFLLNHAATAIGAAGSDKEAKDLKAKIEKDQKDLQARRRT